MEKNNTRRFLSVLVVLVFAATISWWSAKKDSRVVNHIQNEMVKLVPRFASNPTSLHGFVVDPVLEPILSTTLQNVVRESSFQNRGIEIIVTSGDNKAYGDGTATHVALLNINDRPIVGLRIIFTPETDRLQIAGVFPGLSRETKSQ